MFKIIGTGKKQTISVYVDYKLFYFLKEFDEKIKSILTSTYRKFGKSNTFSLEAHAGFFRLLMKGTFVL